MPYSGLKARIAEILLKHNFLKAVRTLDEGTPAQKLELELAYNGEEPAIRRIRRLSKPGLRLYKKSTDLPRPQGGFGLVVISTPKGIMTTEQARRERTGGELILEVLS